MAPQRRAQNPEDSPPPPPDHSSSVSVPGTSTHRGQGGAVPRVFSVYFQDEAAELSKPEAADENQPVTVSVKPHRSSGSSPGLPANHTIALD